MCLLVLVSLPLVTLSAMLRDQESNLALRTITESAGPHPDEVWKAAALCSVEHFVQQEPFFLGLYGYQALSNKMWSPVSDGQQKPNLSLSLSQHIEQAGHTWYIIECELVAVSGDEDSWNSCWPASFSAGVGVFR